MMGVYIIITVILGIHIFAESFNETFGEYYWYVLASFCVTFLLAFVGFLQIRAQHKKDLPDIENWEHERKNLVSDLEEIREIENEKIRAIMVLTNTIKAYESFEKNLEVEEERLESLRVPLRERLSEIEAIEAELSRINDEIVDSLESVAHLTPYNSGF